MRDSKPSVHRLEVLDAVLQRADGRAECEHQEEQGQGEEPHIRQDVTADQHEGGDPSHFTVEMDLEALKELLFSL